MDRDAKIWKLARILVGKHGAAAARTAHDRARDSLEHEDYKGAALWSETAAVAREMTRDGARRRPVNPEPPLDDLLNDPVTRAVMDGDRVGSDELAQVLGDAKQKLDER
jgi:hypothetical protein